MRVSSQLLVLAVLGGAAAGWHFYGPDYGLPRPLALLGLERPAASAPRPNTGAAPQGIGVVVAPVRAGTVVERVESVGTARSREAVNVTARVPGIVSRLLFEEGQEVRAGATLVELDTAQQQADLDQARAALDDARQRLVRARQLRATQAVSEAQIDQLDSAQRQAEARVRSAEARIAEMRIIAPFAGRVGIRNVSPGALLQPGTVVTTLDDTSRIRVEFAVPEVFVARLRDGSPVQAISPAYPARRFAGTVTVIDTRIDAATRAVRVISEFDNSDGALRSGLFLTVILTLDTRENALLVAEDALDPVADKVFVYVVRNDRAVRQEVRIGTRLPGEVEVLSGLRLDEPVVVRGIQRLRPNVPVRITETMRPSV